MVCFSYYKNMQNQKCVTSKAVFLVTTCNNFRVTCNNYFVTSRSKIVTSSVLQVVTNLLQVVAHVVTS